MFSEQDDVAYTNVYVPSDAPTGNYDLIVYDYFSESYQTLENAFLVTPEPEPSINYMSQDSGEQGQSLLVSINTTNILLEDWSGTTSQFRLSSDGQNYIYGTTDYIVSNEMYVNFYIPFNQQIGSYI